MACFRICFTAMALTLAIASSSFAIAGFGLHWGNDFSLKMKDADKEWLSFDKLSINTDEVGTLPSGMEGITGKDLPIYISRTDWERTYLNMGAKFYVDIIPFIDALELSANFGLWQYEGSISYPSALTVKNDVSYNDVKNPEDIFEPTYEHVPLTLKAWDMDYLGLEGTPFAKLGFDLTVRKYVFKFPPVANMLRIYSGAGVSLNFATPVLHRKIIEKALGESLEDAFSLDELGTDLFNNEEVMKDILEEILGGIMTPHWGCHIDVGAHFKLPVIPVGLYVDGKYMIPFDKMDDNVDLGGFGFVLNSGISISF